MAATGIEAIQFNMALAGGPSLPPIVPAIRRGASTLAGLSSMAAVSGTYNMAHPEPAVRDARRRRPLAALIAAAPALGTRVVTLCTGSRDPARHVARASGQRRARGLARTASSRWPPRSRSPSATTSCSPSSPSTTTSSRDARGGAPAARRARARGTSRWWSTPPTSSGPASSTDSSDTLREAFALLGDALVLAHAKDVREDGTVVAAGSGGLDYGLYVRLLRDAGYDGPLVLHGLAEEQVPAAAAFLRER